MQTLSPNLRSLLDRGVSLPLPHTVEVGPEVDPERIAGEGVVIHPGCRISGARTLILPGARIGEEGPATLIDCCLGREVRLKAGFFQGGVFLDGSEMGSGAHVRPGTLLEEKASSAHCVGLKHTILLPYVTLGSLINFCDVLIAGGTGKKDHSEVGSSYIHFNFSPNGDKATPSLLGDVPRGVMLREAAIFLGGQGGLVGPARIGFGTVIAAGTIWRGDFPSGGKLLLGKGSRGGKADFNPVAYRGIPRKVANNLHYLANLLALRRWYLDIRLEVFGTETLERRLLEAAVENLEAGLDERLARLDDLAGRMPASIAALSETDGSARNNQSAFAAGWPAARDVLVRARQWRGDEAKLRELRAETVRRRKDGENPYLETISTLDPEYARLGTNWLAGIADEAVTAAARPLGEAFA